MNEGKSIRLEVVDGFYLSPIVRADKTAYLEHFADPEIAQNLLAIPFPYTEADADWWLDRCERSGPGGRGRSRSRARGSAHSFQAGGEPRGE